MLFIRLQMAARILVGMWINLFILRILINKNKSYVRTLRIGILHILFGLSFKLLAVCMVVLMHGEVQLRSGKRKKELC